MEGPVEWAALIFIVGLMATVAGTAAAVAWQVRGIKADQQAGQAETREMIMKTAEIVTDKISDSRHYLRNEFQGHLGKLENDFHTDLGRVENLVTSVGAKLDMHRAEDATNFRELGERMASLEAAE